MIEEHPQRRRADPIDDAGEKREQPVIVHAFVIKGRQHQHAADAVTDRVADQGRRLGDRTGAGPRDQLRGRDAGRDQPVKQRHALAGRHRIGLAGRAEDREPVGALIEQPAAERDKASGIGLARGGKRGQDRHQNTGKRLRGHAVLLRFSKNRATAPISADRFKPSIFL